MYDRETHYAFWDIVQNNWDTITPETDWNRRMGNAYFDKRLSGAAILFTMSDLTDISPEAHEQAMEDLALVAEEHELDAYDIQKLLEKHEKILAKRRAQPVLWRDADFED